MVIHWDTNEWKNVQAEEDVDFSPEDSEAHRKPVFYSTFNHTFHTLWDEFFEGAESYDAGSFRGAIAGESNFSSPTEPSSYWRTTISW